ncbi:hypothetical protein MLD38_038823 [Melastoma candidum]|uniref:Uncharacterized protein n=1 Tax=Melastoma candidum TaxID=119954 RepID=A0ACB9L042_9MYRT|nr:hypothetical protein MLD38_038823 [Melastoma candidum]
MKRDAPKRRRGRREREDGGNENENGNEIGGGGPSCGIKKKSFILRKVGSEKEKGIRGRMAVTTCAEEFVSPVAPSRMFKALVLDSHKVIPKVVPRGIKSVVFLEGDGGVGSIKQTNFADGGKIKYMRHRMDALDVDKFYCKYTLIGSDVKFDKVEYVVYEVRFEARADGGCVCRMTSEYHGKAGEELKLEHIKQGKQKASGLFKAIEQYLVANPEVCT